MFFKKFRMILLVALFTAASPAFLNAASVQLSWQPNGEPDLQGYNIYVGTQSRHYTTPIPAGNVTQYEVTDLDDGQLYYFTLTAVDNSGNESGYSSEVSHTTVPLPSDTVNPAISISSPTSAESFATQSASIDIAGTASDDQGLQQVSWTTSNGDSGVASGTANWSVQGLALAEGTNNITFTATDHAGNTASDTLVVTYASAPSASPYRLVWSANADRSNSNDLESATISGDVYIYLTPETEVRWVIFYIDGMTHSMKGSAPYDIGLPFHTTSLSDGEHVITAAVTWQDGTAQTFDTTFQVSNRQVPAPDVTAPSLTITSPTSADSFTTQSASIDIAGSASDDRGLQQVTWTTSNGDSGVASGTANWSVQGLALAEGTNNITFTATDNAGNTASDTLVVTYTSASDVTAPSLTITSPTSADSFATQSTSINLAGTASDDQGIQSVTWQTSSGQSGTATGTASWSVAGINISGDMTITVTASDLSGNTSTDTLNVSYETAGTPIDTQAPSVTITSPTRYGMVMLGTPTVDIGGTASDNVGIERVIWENSNGESGTCEGTTNWYARGIQLDQWMNNITVTAIDTSGRRREQRLTIYKY